MTAAKTKGNQKRMSVPKRTSIGMSTRTSPKNKHAKRGFKRYRGQGK